MRMGARPAGDDVRNETSDAVRVETLPWNEHANLAYLYTRKATIFTLDTLPAEEKWYVDQFHGCATDSRSVVCGLDNESSPSTSTTSEGDGVELNNSPPRKSCLASSKKRPKRRISFSAEVSTYVYESDVQEEDVMSSTFKEELQSQPIELLQGDLVS
ncbi:hypothetical protein OESDEN_13667 [Oesophagostomum dentatum]|uniref:Uncharacterized protein n=1 Tax=Oesophagostomum dentatum TaxID=61180 RepID=A0A0B1SRR0_OESDE|nr:hypothetical protein OESDEN_13667 [Oesophagostomum dentatum]